jgi:hypothetical protein
MTAAPLPPLIRPGIQLFEKEWEHLQVWANNHAYAAIAAAQSHFDRTLAERDKRIAELETAYRDATSCKPDRQMVKPDGSPLITPTRWQERAEAAELRAAEAEKDAGRYFDAIQWVVRDASYKAPEQLTSEVAMMWLSVLMGTLLPPETPDEQT